MIETLLIQPSLPLNSADPRYAATTGLASRIASISGSGFRTNRKLAPEDFQIETACVGFRAFGRKFKYPKEYFDFVRKGLVSKGVESDADLMFDAVRNARALHYLYEDALLTQDGQDPHWRRYLLRGKHDDLTRFQGIDDSLTIQKIVIDTAVNAVHFNDENFLSVVQERRFDLGTTLRYRGALASFLKPFCTRDSKSIAALYDDDKETARAAQLAEAQVKTLAQSEKRLNNIFSAVDPFLYVRSSVVSGASYIHRDKAKPMVANGQPLTMLGGSDSELWRDGEEGRKVDRQMSPWLSSLIGTPGARRSNFAAAEVCHELDGQAWAEIAAQLDQRTAEELRACLDGRMTPADVGMSDYMHFRRQCDGPSKLRWLVLAQQRKAMVKESVRLPKSPSGIRTSFETRHPLGWEHTYHGDQLEEYGDLAFRPVLEIVRAPKKDVNGGSPDGSPSRGA